VKNRGSPDLWYGHTNLSWDMKNQPILQIEAIKMIPRYEFNKPFLARFPDTSILENGFQSDRNDGLIWYMDGSKTNEGNGAGVYGYRTRRRLSFSLAQYSTVIQAEVRH
jgi:hypothetical protein